MEVWKISQLFKIFLFIILNFESVFSTAHEELLNLIDCLIRGLDVSRPGEVDENYSSLQVCKIEKSFLALQALQFLRHCTTLWRVCVCMRVLNLVVFYLILLFLLRVWISNSSWLIWYSEATVIYININSKMPCIPIIWNWHATPSAITHWKKKKKSLAMVFACTSSIHILSWLLSLWQLYMNPENESKGEVGLQCGIRLLTWVWYFCITM